MTPEIQKQLDELKKERDSLKQELMQANADRDRYYKLVMDRLPINDDPELEYDRLVEASKGQKPLREFIEELAAE